MRQLSVGLFAALLVVSSPHAQVLREVTNFANEDFNTNTTLDDAGTVVYAVATTNQFGTNPGHRQQIFRWDPATGLGSQVTSFEEGVLTVSVSDDGEWLAFVSNGDLTGANHDESPELFVMRQDGTGLLQLTFDSGTSSRGVHDAVIAGSGGRVVFLADTDPLGTNPGRTPRLFIVNRDGTGLAQIADPSNPYAFAYWRQFDVSDDGERVIFVKAGSNSRKQVFAVQADGTNLRELTASADGVQSVRISGNGQTIVFEDGLISVVNWDGSGLVSPLVADPSTVPTITDDGETVVYQDVINGDIRKINAEGTGATQLIASSGTLRFFEPTVAGGGSRIAFGSRGGQVAGGDNPDGGRELLAMDGTGGGLTQLTLNTLFGGGCSVPSIVPDGTRIYFRQSADLVGANPGHWPQVFTIRRDGTGLAQVTNLTDYSVNGYSVSDAGLVVFSSAANPTGQNPCHNEQIFKVNTDGNGLTQLTPNSCPTSYRNLDPKVRPDGQWVIFQSNLRVGSNTDSSAELFKVATDGTGLAPLTTDNDNVYKHFHIGDTATATYIAFDSQSNADGKNADKSYEVFLIKLDGTGLRRVTQDPVYDSFDPDISGNGNRIVWYSQADPLGTNPDHSNEVFLFEKATSTTRQLTNTNGGIFLPVRITRDGAWVYYNKDDALVRQAVDTGVVERVQGFGHKTTAISILSTPGLNEVGFDRTGSRAVFCGQDVVDGSPSAYSPFLADQTLQPAIDVGEAAPTLVTWDADPQSVFFDVIRGDVANLSIASGGNVDLGPVACLEDDSPDNHMHGFEDTAQPAPGRVFFYLVRGTTGVPPLTGSWGQGSGARERIAGVGSCNP